MQVSGKKALVLGGTSGIGLATANQLAGEGASVVAASRDPGKASDGLVAGIELKACDILNRDGLAELFSAYAPFDILVCAATGGSRAAGPVLEMELDAYQGAFAKLWGYTNSVRLGSGTQNKTGADSLEFRGRCCRSILPRTCDRDRPAKDQRRVSRDYRYSYVRFARGRTYQQARGCNGGASYSASRYRR